MQQLFSSQYLGMNSTVLYDGDAAFLIDPGVFPPEIDRIEKFIHEKKFSKLSVLLTHTHGDHIAGWYRFRDFPVFSHRSVSQKTPDMQENDLRYIRGMWRKMGYETPAELAFPHPLTMTDDGDIRTAEPYPFVFYSAPGHSVDMSVIIFPEQKLIFSGDMLILSPLPFILKSVRQYQQSLLKLRDLTRQYGLKMLIPGHGKPASAQTDILGRIAKELDYTGKLLDMGKTLSQAGLEEAELRRQLYEIVTDEMSQHAHQTNVQTMLRELEVWQPGKTEQ